MVKKVKGKRESTMKQAKLTIGDRITILEMLPPEGNFATLKIVRKLREQLSLTEDEIKKQKVIQIKDKISWQDGNKTTEMEFGEFAENMIVDALKKLDTDNKLEDKHFGLYEIFVEVKE